MAHLQMRHPCHKVLCNRAYFVLVDCQWAKLEHAKEIVVPALKPQGRGEAVERSLTAELHRVSSPSEPTCGTSRPDGP